MSFEQNQQKPEKGLKGFKFGMSLLIDYVVSFGGSLQFQTFFREDF